MRIFSVSEGNAMYVSEKQTIPKSDNLILTATKIVTTGAVCIAAIVIGGIWAVCVIGGVAFFGMCIKAVDI